MIFLTRDILCIDKTGTLTMNRAIMIDHVDCWRTQRDQILQFAFLNSYFKTDHKYPLDDAITAYVYTNSFRFQPSKWSKVDEIPFDFIRRRVSIILETNLGVGDNRSRKPHDRLMVTKGALEEVMKVCSYVDHYDKGGVTPFSDEEYQRIVNLGEEISNEGLRILGVAIKRLPMVCLRMCLHFGYSFNSRLNIGMFRFCSMEAIKAKA